MISDADLNPRDIRDRLYDVLAAASALPPSDKKSISGLIGAGEWGLALDTICTQVYEYEIVLAPEIKKVIYELADRTDVDARRLLGEI